MDKFTTSAELFGFILARVMGLFFTAPVLNSESLPFRMRVILSFMLSILIYPVTVNFLPELPKHLIGYAFALAGQALIGMCIGYMIIVIFAAFQLAGEVLSIQSGFSLSEVLDPQSQISLPIIGTLKNLIAMLLFVGVDFQMDGHNNTAMLHTVRAVTYSFTKIPEIAFTKPQMGTLLNYMDSALGVMFLTALKIGIPIMGILFITSVALGLLGRAAPQMNLMNLGVQINIGVALVIMVIIIPVITPLMQESYHVMFDKIADLFRSWPSSGDVK